MNVFPAIDMIDSKVVRLYKGDYDKVTNYSLSPLEAATTFEKEGAEYLHAVDLSGAKSGTPVCFEAVRDIIQSTHLYVEIGGGIRREEDIERYLDCGAGRVILGTAAARDPEFLKDMVARFGDRVAVGVDAAQGRVAVDGWKTETDLDAVEFCERLRDFGVSSVIYTDISRDGTLKGANIEIYRRLQEIGGLKITASGGVTTEDDIEKLKDTGIWGVIVGKALYEGKMTVERAIAAAK